MGEFCSKAAQGSMAAMKSVFLAVLIAFRTACAAQSGTPWQPPPMAVPRAGLTIIPRTDGKLYIASDRTTYPATHALDMEVYDYSAGSQLVPAHAVVPDTLGAETGIGLSRDRVLVCRIADCHVFDPSTNSWTAYTIPGVNGDMAKLPNGAVLRSGGFGSNSIPPSYAVDPDTFSASRVADLNLPTTAPAFASLRDGRVLAIGGLYEITGFGGFIQLVQVEYAQLFDPKMNTWSTSSMIPPLGGDRILALTLMDGRVLAGNGEKVAPMEAEIYDPATNRWSQVAGLLWASYAQAVQLPNGTVILSGGYTAPSDNVVTFFNTTLLWDPKSGVVSNGRPMQLPRSGHGIATLPDGTILAFGGATTRGTETASVEVMSYGQPQARLTLGPNFYVTTATESSPTDDGFWGLQAAIPGATAGGIFFGGLLAAQGSDVVYSAFTIGEPQTVTVRADLFALPGSRGALNATLRVLDAQKNPLPNGSASGASNVTWSGQLAPGFYVVELRSDANSPAAAVNASIAATRLLGGASAGGLLQWSAGVTGYLAFAIADKQDVAFQVFNEQTYGIPRGAQSVILSVYDSSGKPLKRLAPPGIDLTGAPAPAPQFTGRVPWKLE